VSRAGDERGQTATEYLMIAGLLTAMLIVLTSIVVPTMKTIGVEVVKHMVLHLSSPPREENAPPPPCPEFVEPEQGVDCQ
jgi:Flp pilus assembly pilin Flp